MIVNFKCKYTKKIWNGEFVKKFPSDIQSLARRKLRMIYAANCINSLRVPPANRLKKLQGNKNEIYSIRINDQWRICFSWLEGNAYTVEIVDYH